MPKLRVESPSTMSIVRAADVGPSTALDRRIRVMIVDDAIVARRLSARWIDAEPDMTVIACLRTGREAVDQIEQHDPDVVILDVDMPELDGIAALPLLLKKKPDLVVIMASALTRRSAEVSLRALSLGAADYVPKPGAAPDAGILAAFQHELIEKIRNLGGRLLARQGRAGAIASRPLLAPRLRESVPLQAEAPAFSLRPFAHCLPRVLLIGSSTGGPQALTTLIGQFGAAIERAPILITQHMPPTFTTVLAEHLARSSSRRVLEAVQGEVVVPAVSTWRRAAAICASCAAATAPRSRSATIRRSIFAGRRSIRCCPRRPRYGARPVSRLCSPAWAATGRAAPPRLWRPAAA